MRALPLGHWIQFSWHAAALALLALACAVAFAAARSLRRDDLTGEGAYLRWEVIGWSTAVAAALSVCVWPYLTAFARIEVTPTGRWRLENYLGVTVAEVPPRELRGLTGEDLGGRQVGVGTLTVRRADGSLVRSVRITADAFSDALRVLGYSDGDALDVGGSRVIPPHRFTSHGPQRVDVLASAAR
ncbi:MAG: hypothetical protein U0325_03215 [Polyangiales bacterium]